MTSLSSSCRSTYSRAFVVVEKRSPLRHHHCTRLELEMEQTGAPQQYRTYSMTTWQNSHSQIIKITPDWNYRVSSFGDLLTDINNYAEDSQTNQQTDKPRKNTISLSHVQQLN